MRQDIRALFTHDMFLHFIHTLTIMVKVYPVMITFPSTYFRKGKICLAFDYDESDFMSAILKKYLIFPNPFIRKGQWNQNQ